jgi:hypothetical protein
MGNLSEVKEQIQQDLISLFEGFGIDEAMESQDYAKFTNIACDIVITNLNRINENKPQE